MASKRLVPALLAVVLIAVTGCTKSKYRTANDITMKHMDLSSAQYGEQFTYMSDNAILRDMSLADFHFVGHTGEISGVGQVRLDRMARLLNTYGGTVRYETDLPEGELVKQRIDHVREYLTLVGVDMNRVEVAPKMSGGQGMSGPEAIEHYKRGTAKPANVQMPTIAGATSGS